MTSGATRSCRWCRSGFFWLLVNRTQRFLLPSSPSILASLTASLPSLPVSLPSLPPISPHLSCIPSSFEPPPPHPLHLLTSHRLSRPPSTPPFTLSLSRLLPATLPSCPLPPPPTPCKPPSPISPPSPRIPYYIQLDKICLCDTESWLLLLPIEVVVNNILLHSATLQESPSSRGNVCPARARRATFLLTIPTSAPDLPSHGEAPPSRPRFIAHLPHKARCIIGQ